MGTPAKLNLTIYQGANFQYILRWESLPIVYKNISAITKAAPAQITCTGHGVPDGWRVAITNVKGMKQINAATIPPKASDFKKATLVNANTLTLNDVNSTDYSTYTSGGVLQYYTPTSLASYTARMKIKNKVGGTELFSLTTANARIALDDVTKTIALSIVAADTAALTFTDGVYDLELVSPGGVVTRVVEGTVTVSKEVTTT